MGAWPELGAGLRDGPRECTVRAVEGKAIVVVCWVGALCGVVKRHRVGGVLWLGCHGVAWVGLGDVCI